MSTESEPQTYNSENPTIQKCFSILKSGDFKIRKVSNTDLIVVNDDFAIDTDRLLVPFSYGIKTVVASIKLFRDKSNSADLKKLYNLCKKELEKQTIIEIYTFSKDWSNLDDTEVRKNIKYLLKYYKDCKYIKQSQTHKDGMWINGIFLRKTKLGNRDAFYIRRKIYWKFIDREIYGLLDELFNKCKQEILNRQKLQEQTQQKALSVFGKIKRFFAAKTNEFQK